MFFNSLHLDSDLPLFQLVKYHFDTICLSGSQLIMQAGDFSVGCSQFESRGPAMLHEFIPAIISIAFLLVAFLYAFASDPHRAGQMQEVAECSSPTPSSTIQTGTGISS
jgi:hypothetical protein